jgi:hypothetical protein
MATGIIMSPQSLIYAAKTASEEQFRKATESEYRLWFFNFAFFPMFLVVGSRVLTRISESTASATPFYVFASASVFVYGMLCLTIGRRRIHPVILLPVAAVSWTLLAMDIWKHMP